jgi:hypothetical protein
MVGVFRVRIDVESHRRAEPQLGSTHESGDLLVGAGGGDGLQCHLRGTQARTLDGFGVEIRAIEVVELLPVAAGGAALGERVENVAHLLQGALAQHGKTAPRGTVRWDLRRIEPVTVRIAGEVIARLDARIAARKIETKAADLGITRGGNRGGRAGGNRGGRARAGGRLHAEAECEYATAEQRH